MGPLRAEGWHLFTVSWHDELPCELRSPGELVECRRDDIDPDDHLAACACRVCFLALASAAAPPEGSPLFIGLASSLTTGLAVASCASPPSLKRRWRGAESVAARSAVASRLELACATTVLTCEMWGGVHHHGVCMCVCACI